MAAQITCPYCHNIAVELIREGDITCLTCGTVLQSHVIDTRPIHDTRHCNYTFEYNDEGDDDILRACNVLQLPDIIIHMAQSLFKEATEEQTLKGQHRKEAKAEAIYKACQAQDIYRPKQDICTLLSVHRVRTQNNNISGFRDRYNSKACILFKDSKTKMAILRTCLELEARLEQIPSFMNKRPSKMDGVLVFVAAVQNNIKISKQNIINVFGLSMVTFNKHLKFVESLLA